MRNVHRLTSVLLIGLLVACSGNAAATPEPDRIATGVAEAKVCSGHVDGWSASCFACAANSKTNARAANSACAQAAHADEHADSAAGRSVCTGRG